MDLFSPGNKREAKEYMGGSHDFKSHYKPAAQSILILVMCKVLSFGIGLIQIIFRPFSTTPWGGHTQQGVHGRHPYPYMYGYEIPSNL